MKLGLDLSGGVHFLLEVDLDSALATRLEGDLQEVKSSLRDEKIRYRSFELKGQQIIGRFRNEQQFYIFFKIFFNFIVNLSTS